MREMWIPAFFRDTPLSGLMRTTSRSESANSAFKKTAHWGNTLVKFFRSFEAAMDKQRHNQLLLDHFSQNSKIKSKVSVDILHHAAEIYTNELLKKVQREIEDSIFSCFQHSIESDNSFDRIVVMERRNVSAASKEVDTSEEEADEDVVPENTLFYKVCFKL